MAWDDNHRWLEVSASPDIWTWSSTSQTFFDLRMLAFKLKTGGLVVVSPVPEVDEASLAVLDSYGPVTAILAPNYYHNLGIKNFLRRYPAAKLYAHDRAIPRLEKVTGLNFASALQLADLLPNDLHFAFPEGLKQGEVWLYTESKSQNSGILAVCDCFFNMRSEKNFIWDKVFRLANTYPGLKVSRVFGWTAVADRDRYREWLRHFFSQSKMTVMIPSHGEIYESLGLADELLALNGL